MKIFGPGTEVTANDSLGGYSGVVVAAAGTFEALEGSGWRTATQIRITDPADGRWAVGDLVDVETSLLVERNT